MDHGSIRPFFRRILHGPLDSQSPSQPSDRGVGGRVNFPVLFMDVTPDGGRVPLLHALPKPGPEAIDYAAPLTVPIPVRRFDAINLRECVETILR